MAAVDEIYIGSMLAALTRAAACILTVAVTVQLLPFILLSIFFGRTRDAACALGLVWSLGLLFRCGWMCVPEG